MIPSTILSRIGRHSILNRSGPSVPRLSTNLGNPGRNFIVHAKRVKGNKSGTAVAPSPSPSPTPPSSPSPPPGGRRTPSSEVLLTVDNLTKTHDGEKILFNNLNFAIPRGERIAVVGPNGAGKSSLLKLIGGLDMPTSGAVTKKRAVTVGYLEQSPELNEESTILEAALQGVGNNDVARVAFEYEAAAAAAESGDPAAAERLSKATSRMDALNAWQISWDAKDLLTEFGLPDMGMKIKEMSGGQRRRLCIAGALLQNPDLIVMDEPTNHLDIFTIDQLSSRIVESNNSLLFVSHDREFLDTICTKILELDGYGGAYVHNVGGRGAYNEYRRLRADRMLSQQNAADNAKTLLRKEAVWMSRQPKGRQAKAKARETRFYELTAKSRSAPKADLKVQLSDGTGAARQGNDVMDLQEICVGWNGFQLFRDFTYTLTPGEKLGIVGRNGAGKSTLLDMIAGVCPIESGQRIVGTTTKIGYFTQHPPPVDEKLRILDYVKTFVDAEGPKGLEVLRQAERDEIAALQVSTQERKSGVGAGAPGATANRPKWATMGPEVLLERLGFERKRQQQRVGSLSGGERRRLHLATVLLSRPNLLLLDEPTNDLDLTTIEVLEDFLLEEFSGTLLVVSHDRAFMGQVPDSLLVLEGDGLVRLYDGTYEEYLEDAGDLAVEGKRLQAAAAAAKSRSDSPAPEPAKSNGAGNGVAARAEAPAASPAPSPSPAPSSTATKKKPLSNFEMREYAKLEAEIEKLTARKASLQAQITAAASDHTRLASLGSELDTVVSEMEKKEGRWLELADRA